MAARIRLGQCSVPWSDITKWKVASSKRKGWSEMHSFGQFTRHFLPRGRWNEMTPAGSVASPSNAPSVCSMKSSAPPGKCLQGGVELGEWGGG